MPSLSTARAVARASILSRAEFDGRPDLETRLHQSRVRSAAPPKPGHIKLSAKAGPLQRQRLKPSASRKLECAAQGSNTILP